MAFRGFAMLMCLIGTLAAAFGAAVNETANTGWVAVASDDSGQYLSALGKGLYVSNDYGATWTVTSASTTAGWSSVASDATGQKLMLSTMCNGSSSYCQGPWTSTDRGATWTAPSSKDPYDNYYGIASDSTGQYGATAGGLNYYGSGDGGLTWGPYLGIEEYYGGTAVAMSGDHHTIVIDYYEYIYLNKNGAGFKKTNTPEARWRGLGSDYTGTVISGAFDMAYGSGGNFQSGWYLSTDAGATFTALKFEDDGDKYYSVAVSDDGKYVYCGGSAGVTIYNVAKKTLTKSNAPSYGIYSIATSKDGKYVIYESGGIYVSSNYGMDYKKVLN